MFLCRGCCINYVELCSNLRVSPGGIKLEVESASLEEVKEHKRGSLCHENVNPRHNIKQYVHCKHQH